jgi:F-type H+-transporting ATPase subunit delta
MSTERVAKRYATALMIAATEGGVVARVASDVDSVGRTISGSRELTLLVKSPVVSVEKKAEIFKALFAQQIGALSMEFFTLMIAKRREGVIPALITEFNRLRDEKDGIINVQVTSAHEVSTAQQKQLATKLEAMTGKKVRLQLALNESLKGGLLVRIGDTVMDSSIKRQLELLREQFVFGGAVPQ